MNAKYQLKMKEQIKDITQSQLLCLKGSLKVSSIQIPSFSLGEYQRPPPCSNLVSLIVSSHFLSISSL